MNNQNDLAVIYITHNHPQTVEDVLSNSASYYNECGVDIIYLDSSESEETADIVNKYIQAGNKNITYIPCPGFEARDKMKSIFAGEGIISRYKYIWPSKDRSYVSQRFLNELLNYIDGDYDLIFTFHDLYNKTEYSNAVEFYKDYANWVTSLNLTIYNSRTLLMNYGIASKPYFCAGSEEFLQNAAIFYGLAQLDHPRIRLIDMHDDDLKMSLLSNSMEPHSIATWKDNWIKVNEYLPQIYDEYKDAVIKSISVFPWILEDVDILIELKENGEINKENLDWVLDGWERISNIPPKTVIEIVEGTYDITHDVSLINSSDEMVGLLVRLCNALEREGDCEFNLPVDSIFLYFMKKINAVAGIEKNKRRIITGSFKDILSDIQQERDKETIKKRIQEIISFLLLLE